jgi:8-oxo-dGTP pyrophosphatase MutT (NUDIX family)
MTSQNDTPVNIRRKVQVVVFTRTPQLRVLTLRRPREMGHIWQPVTGNVDAADATWSEAARREVAEEAGIEDPLHVTDMKFDFRFESKGVQFVERLVALETSDAGRVVLSSEHVDYAWLPLEEAVGRMKWDINRDGVRRVIDAVSDERWTP